MTNQQFVTEFAVLEDKRPTYYITGVFSWIIWAFCFIIGWLFFALFIGNLLTGSVWYSLLESTSETPVETHVKENIVMNYGFSFVCFFVAILFLFIAKLTRAILKRNKYINRQKEFTEKILDSHRILERAVSVVVNQKKP